MNDQLVDVNGVSLLGMNNTRGIQVLREAMKKEGRIRGFIGITVLRPRAARNTARSTDTCREIRVSQADHESDSVVSTVSTLPQPNPVERLTADDVNNKDIHSVADSLSVSFPSDAQQV